MHDTTRERFWALDIGYCASLKMRCFRRDGVARLMPDGPDSPTARRGRALCSAQLPVFPPGFDRSDASPRQLTQLHFFIRINSELASERYLFFCLVPKTKEKSTMPPKSNNQKKKEAEARGAPPKKTKQQENAGQSAKQKKKEMQAKKVADKVSQVCWNICGMYIKHKIPLQEKKSGW